MSGGSSTICGLPSTTVVSFANACRLSFVRAFAIPVSVRLRIVAVVVAARISSDVMWLYQTSRSRIVANSAIRAR